MMDEKNYNNETEFDFDKVFESADNAVSDTDTDPADVNTDIDNQELNDGQNDNSMNGGEVTESEVTQTAGDNIGIAEEACARAEAFAAELGDNIKKHTRKA